MGEMVYVVKEMIVGVSGDGGGLWFKAKMWDRFCRKPVGAHPPPPTSSSSVPHHHHHHPYQQGNQLDLSRILIVLLRVYPDQTQEHILVHRIRRNKVQWEGDCGSSGSQVCSQARMVDHDQAAVMKIKDDIDLAEFIALGFKNEKVIDLYVEHHTYDISHWEQTEIDVDEVSDVSEMEYITSYCVNDFVEEDDAMIPNRTISDPFPNYLCNRAFIMRILLLVNVVKVVLRRYLCNRAFISDYNENSSTGECSEGSAKEINSDDENARTATTKKGKGKGVHTESPAKKGNGKGMQIGSLAKKGKRHNNIQRKKNKKLGRKKVGSSFVFPIHVVATCVDASGAVPIDNGQSRVAASQTNDFFGDVGDTRFMNEVQMEETMTEDLIEEFKANKLPTQHSKTSTQSAQVIEHAIIVRVFLKNGTLKRMCKLERTAKRYKPYQFGPHGRGASAEKTWVVDDVLT
ncbi:hypothetical protein Tco_0214826 [Tanacetum coccineum]